MRFFTFFYLTELVLVLNFPAIISMSSSKSTQKQVRPDLKEENLLAKACIKIKLAYKMFF